MSVGGDADLIVWDPTQSVQSHSNLSMRERRFVADVYDGLALQGRPSHVLYAGHVVLDNHRVGTDNIRHRLFIISLF